MRSISQSKKISTPSGLRPSQHSMSRWVTRWLDSSGRNTLCDLLSLDFDRRIEMNLPGFTAASSLSEPTQSYRARTFGPVPISASTVSCSMTPQAQTGPVRSQTLGNLSSTSWRLSDLRLHMLPLSLLVHDCWVK